MNVRRPECDEHPANPIARYAVAKKLTMLTGVIGRRRVRTGQLAREPSLLAPLRQGFAEVGDALEPVGHFFFAAGSWSSMTRPISPVGSRTIGQVRFAISPARNPALTDSKTITRLRAGYGSVGRRQEGLVCGDQRGFLPACLPCVTIKVND